MSVPTWRRSLSKTEYLYQTFQLSIRIGQIVANLPKKYSDSYGNYLIRTSLEALKYGQTANDIPINADEDNFKERRALLRKMHGCINNISTVAYLYLETARKQDNLSRDKYEKMYDWENEIGEKCYDINKMIRGVAKYDRESFKKHKKSGD